jgi:hypothetical protein
MVRLKGAGQLGNNFIERVNHWRSFGSPVRFGFVERRSRETHDLASFGLGDLMVLNYHHNSNGLCCRRYNFLELAVLGLKILYPFELIG